jgi:hypothetical protein
MLLASSPIQRCETNLIKPNGTFPGPVKTEAYGFQLRRLKGCSGGKLGQGQPVGLHHRPFGPEQPRFQGSQLE